MPKVVFDIEGGKPVTAECNVGDNLLELARRANVAIDAPCSGNGSCGKCRVRLTAGELDSIQTRHISDEEYAQGWRLSCSSKVAGDCTVFVPDIASAYQSRMKTADLSSPKEVAIFDKAQEDLKKSGIHFTNSYRSVVLTMAEPSLDDTMPDNERLTWAIEEALGVETVKIPHTVMVRMAAVLRENNFTVCVKGRLEGNAFTCMEICSPENTAIYGCAIDIGTTTVTMVMTDLTSGKILAKGSSGNGQIRYGADVINRIIEQGKPGGKKKLQDAIIKETLTPIMAGLCKSAGLDPRSILSLCVGANTTMNHLLLGVDSDPVRMEPYIPTFFKTNSVYASDIGVKINPDAHIILAPNIGSYVGGDITAGAFVSMLWNQPEFSLFIDLGTNGEIVFGNSDFMMSCACSAGPAFEGGDISCGMRATDGAIEACTIDEETMEPSLSIIGEEGTKPVGLCGSGIIDVIAELFRCKMLSPKGKFIREGKRIRHDKYGMGSYVLAFQEEAGSVKDVEITEVDIDNFIRAKGAIFSAIRTMLSYCDFDISMIERVYVAGGIGSGINMRNAIRIGMFPAIPVEMYHYIGNSSLAGAYAMLYSTESEKKVYELAKNMTYIELSTIPQYMDEFVAACFLPHTDASLFADAE